MHGSVKKTKKKHKNKEVMFLCKYDVLKCTIKKRWYKLLHIYTHKAGVEDVPRAFTNGKAYHGVIYEWIIG